MNESDGIDEAIEDISRAGMSVAGRLADQLAKAHDSAARREALAASLDGVADREAVQARLIADQDQARPPSVAVAKALGKAANEGRARGTIGPAKVMQKGMSR
jgi:colicin import membrane protein